MDLNLHFFDSDGLITKFLPSQNSIPCNLCIFNIKESALKDGVNKNLILLNPSFYLACPIAPPPLSLFMSYLSYCFSFFFLFLTPLLFSLFLACLSYYPFLSFLTSTLPILLPHTLLLSLFLSCCHTHPFSVFLPYLFSHTYTHTPSFPFLPCLSYHTFT
jgi:hypothetical protein